MSGAGNAAVELWRAHARGDDAAAELLTSFLADGRWREAPGEWLEVARRVAKPDGAIFPLPHWLEGLAAKIVAGPLDDAARHALMVLGGGLAFTSAEESLKALCKWLVKAAEPGDAALVVAVLGNLWMNNPARPEVGFAPLPGPAHALVEWLLQSGAAELRMHGRPRARSTTHDGASRNSQSLRGADLLLRITEAVDLHGPPELFKVALRYLLIAEAVDPGWQQHREVDVWRLVERGLREGLPPASAIEAFVQLERRRMSYADQWRPLEPDSAYPLTARALVDAVAAAAFPRHVRQSATTRVLSHDPPAAVALGAAYELLSAAISAYIGRPDVFGAAPPPRERVGKWVRVVAACVAEHLTPRLHDSQVTRILANVSSHDPGACAAVIDGFAQVHPAGTATGDLARGGPAHPSLVKALILSLTTTTQGPRAESRLQDLSPLRHALERMLHRPWQEPIAGIDIARLLDGVTGVELTTLADDRAVLIDGATLKVADAGPGRTFAQNAVDAAVLECLLYVTHELCHVAQGVAGMEVVREVRAIGAESTLLQVDLAADHFAARVVTEVLRDVDLLRAKDVNSRALRTFRVGTVHTEAARQRKAVRFASVRFDLAARRRWPAHEVHDAFFMLDYAPGGERCLVFLSDRLLRLVCPPLELKGEERAALVACADETRPFDEVLRQVDTIVERLAREAWEQRFHRGAPS